MAIPMHIQFGGVSRSLALERAIRVKLHKLDHQCAGVIAWQVTVGKDHEHMGRPRNYSVHIDASLPGADLVSRRTGAADAHTAVHEAFEAMRRRLHRALHRRRDTGIREAAYLPAALPGHAAAMT